MVWHGRLFQQNILAAMRAFQGQEFDQGRFYMHCPLKVRCEWFLSKVARLRGVFSPFFSPPRFSEPSRATKRAQVFIDHLFRKVGLTCIMM